MTKDPRQLPVVDVDQAFPLLTTDGAARGGSPASAGGGDQGPAVAAALRDVLGWRPRTQDTKAFNAALAAAFELNMVEGHREATYVQRGIAVQADLGGITGGQASLYSRAQSSHEQITRMLDGVKPLRPDADPEDCEAFRALIRDSVRQVVQELGMPGGPRVQLIDSAFRTLTGFEPNPPPVKDDRPVLDGRRQGELALAEQGEKKPLPPATPAALGQTADDVPGTLGALRDRMGLTDDNVNTVDEEKIRTSFLTLVDLVIDLQRSWDQQRVAFQKDAGRGFLGTEMILISRLLAAAAEQVDEVEAVLDSALISAAERQTIVIDRLTRLTLDGLLSWMRTFLTEDGPRIIQDTGRDGITTSFTPTAVTLLQTLRNTVVAQLPTSTPRYGSIPTSLLPVGCCSRLPAGMFAARTRIAFSGLCSLLEQLVRNASRIGRFSGVILFDLFVTPYIHRPDDRIANRADFLRVEVRGLHLRPGYLPAFIRTDRTGRERDELVLPVQGSASSDSDSMVAVFRAADINAIKHPFQQDETDRQDDFDELFKLSSWTVPAAAVPIAVFDSETGRVVLAPPVRTWPDLVPANTGGDLNLDPGLGNTSQVSFGTFAIPPDEPDDCDCDEPESRYDSMTAQDGGRRRGDGRPGTDPAVVDDSRLPDPVADRQWSERGHDRDGGQGDITLMVSASQLDQLAEIVRRRLVAESAVPDRASEPEGDRASELGASAPPQHDPSVDTTRRSRKPKAKQRRLRRLRSRISSKLSRSGKDPRASDAQDGKSRTGGRDE